MTHSTNLVDRCDRCGAAAKFQVLINASGGELFFCLHHANEHAAVIDERQYPTLPLIVEGVSS